MAASRCRCRVKSTHSPLYQHFINGLRAERKAIGVTQEQLAERLRDGQSFISKVERGERRIDVAEFVKIAHAIGVNPVTLFGRLVDAFPMEPAARNKRLRNRRSYSRR